MLLIACAFNCRSTPASNSIALTPHPSLARLNLTPPSPTPRFLQAKKMHCHMNMKGKFFKRLISKTFTSASSIIRGILQTDEKAPNGLPTEFCSQSSRFIPLMNLGSLKSQSPQPPSPSLLTSYTTFFGHAGMARP